MKEIKGPYEVYSTCKCLHPKIISVHDYRSGWGKRICEDCEKHYKWGIKDLD